MLLYKQNKTKKQNKALWSLATIGTCCALLRQPEAGGERDTMSHICSEVGVKEKCLLCCVYIYFMHALLGVIIYKWLTKDLQQHYLADKLLFLCLSLVLKI